MKQFHIGVKAAIVQNNKILLLRKVNNTPFWELPGGRIDENETIMDALARELKEELPNLTGFSVAGIVGAERLEKEYAPDVGLVLLFYEVHATFSGQPQLSKEHDTYKWAEKEEALELVNAISIPVIRLILA